MLGMMAPRRKINKYYFIVYLLIGFFTYGWFVNKHQNDQEYKHKHYGVPMYTVHATFCGIIWPAYWAQKIAIWCTEPTEDTLETIQK